jgi:hypothetical protein
MEELCTELDEYGEEIQVQCEELCEDEDGKKIKCPVEEEENDDDEEDSEEESESDEKCEDITCMDDEDLEEYLDADDADIPDWLKDQLKNLEDIDEISEEEEETIPFKAKISEMSRLGEITILFTQPVTALQDDKTLNKGVITVKQAVYDTELK